MKHAQHRFHVGLFAIVLLFGCSDALDHGGSPSGRPDAGGSPPPSGTNDATTIDAPSLQDAFTPAVGDGAAEAGTAVDADASFADAPGTVRDDAGASSDAAPRTDFVCSWVLGIHTTYEWFSAGFEKVVDDARWQVSGIEMAQFEWKDPNSPFWASPITSPCATNSKTPDRIVFCGVDTASTTVAQFLPEYVASINNIKTKFPSVKRIDIMTTARGPGNMECIGANRSSSSYIKAAQDQAIAMMVDMFPGFVYATPKWEVMSCSDFTLCPHITAAANQTLAKTIGDYFLTH